MPSVQAAERCGMPSCPTTSDAVGIHRPFRRRQRSSRSLPRARLIQPPSSAQMSLENVTQPISARPFAETPQHFCNLRRRFRPFAGVCRFLHFNDTRNDTRLTYPTRARSRESSSPLSGSSTDVSFQGTVVSEMEWHARHNDVWLEQQRSFDKERMLLMEQVDDQQACHIGARDTRMVPGWKSNSPVSQVVI
jgi:hypothetical protein